MIEAPGTAGHADFLSDIIFSDDFRENPYPYFRHIREEQPVYRSRVGVWVVSRYADVQRALRDPSIGNDLRKSASHSKRISEQGRAHHVDDRFVQHLLFLDPPDHGRIRSLVSRAFTPRTISQERQRIKTLVDELLTFAVSANDGHLDVVGDLAYPVATTVICGLLGVPSEDHETFQDWARRLSASIDPEFLIDAGQKAAAAAAAKEFARYLIRLVSYRRRHLGHDVLSTLINATETGDRLTAEELIVNGILLIVVGYETTINLIGNGILALLRAPDQLSRLHKDPGIIANAVEELLRYDSPIQYTPRVTLRECLIGDTVVPAGQELLLLLGSANRDVAAFPDADQLDLSRVDARRHVAFGGGPHFCLGAPLARLEGEVVIGELIGRYPRLALAGIAEHTKQFAVRGLKQLPVKIA